MEETASGVTLYCTHCWHAGFELCLAIEGVMCLAQCVQAGTWAA